MCFPKLPRFFNTNPRIFFPEVRILAYILAGLLACPVFCGLPVPITIETVAKDMQKPCWTYSCGYSSGIINSTDAPDSHIKVFPVRKYSTKTMQK